MRKLIIALGLAIGLGFVGLGQWVTPVEATFIPRVFTAIRTGGTVTLGPGTTSAVSTAFTAVTLANSFVELKGCRSSGGAGSGDSAYIQLTSTTQVTASRLWSNGTTICKFDVFQVDPRFIKSIQRNALAFGSGGPGATVPFTVTATVVANSTLHMLGCTTNDNASGVIGNWIGHIEQTAPTTITGTADGVSGIICAWELIEWR